MGKFLRRYWHPVAGSSELDQNPIKPLRILGEDLVLFKTKAGAFGLMPSRCHHRGADLSFGFVEEDGIRCCYHGWKYDYLGTCIDRPFDNNVNSNRKPLLKSGPGYLVREKAGLLWAYVGPARAPELPDWEAFTWHNAFTQVVIAEVPCNWLQCQENTVDPVHFEWLHDNAQQRRMGDLGPSSPRTMKMAIEDRPYGLQSRRYREGTDETTPLWSVGRAIVWPNGWYFGHSFSWNVPVDDTHTLHIVRFALHVPKEYEPYRQASIPTWHALIKDERGKWISDNVSNQDFIAWISQGEIYDRTKESLGASDVGVVALRRRLLQDLEAIEQGHDPRCLIRDPKLNKCIELPCVDHENFKNGLPLAEMQEHHVMGGFLRGLPIAGQPREIREAFEEAMHVKTSHFDIHNIANK
jgi:5,5'-dehydrodivanillate O-demethylase